MKLFSIAFIACFFISSVTAQTNSEIVKGEGASDKNTKSAAGKVPVARLFSDQDVSAADKAPVVYTADQVKDVLKHGDGTVSNVTIKGNLSIASEQDNLKFTRVVFDGDLEIRDTHTLVSFEHCEFKRNVDFSLVSKNLVIRDCKFYGSAWFQVDVSGFTLLRCEFEKIVDFQGTRFRHVDEGGKERKFDEKGKELHVLINMTRLVTRQPIKIKWTQFGDKWLTELNRAAAGLSKDGEEARLNREFILSELEFWKQNFANLDHQRDASEVNYEIIQLGIDGVTEQRGSTDWWIATLLNLPNRYGTRPYRPIWIGLTVITLFAIFYWLANPFTPKDDDRPPKKSNRPLFLFSLMYSIDTFIPVIDVTKVRDWGWEISGPYRWVTVAERLFGLAIFYSVTTSVAYYIF